MNGANTSVKTDVVVSHEKSPLSVSFMRLAIGDMVKYVKQVVPRVKECWNSFVDAFRVESFRAKGARRHFEAAFALVVVIPLLVLTYLVSSGSISINFVSPFAPGILIGLLPPVLVGTWLLVKYPLAVLKLRNNLQKMARGEMPVSINLSREGDDLVAIESFLNVILTQTKERIETINNQQESILKAEREKVMMESLATVCHHIGQPATTLICCVDILEREGLPDGLRPILTTCCDASNILRDLLRDLQLMDVYRATDYLDFKDENNNSLPKILEIKKSA